MRHCPPPNNFIARSSFLPRPPSPGLTRTPSPSPCTAAMDIIASPPVTIQLASQLPPGPSPYDATTELTKPSFPHSPCHALNGVTALPAPASPLTPPPALLQPLLLSQRPLPLPLSRTNWPYHTPARPPAPAPPISPHPYPTPFSSPCNAATTLTAAGVAGGSNTGLLLPCAAGARVKEVCLLSGTLEESPGSSRSSDLRPAAKVLPLRCTTGSSSSD